MGPRNRQCPDDFGYMLEQNMCLHALSKNVEGPLTDHQDNYRERCTDPPCTTLKCTNSLRISVNSHQDPECDSDPALRLDGEITVDYLVHVFDNDATRRGYHSGEFTWAGRGLLAFGRLSGVTNAGTHRGPVFEECQSCNAPGFMEGQFCGTIRRSETGELLSCGVFGTYRLRFPDTSPDSVPGQTVSGTMEGVIVCECRGL
jgi:hypothetical protein